MIPLLVNCNRDRGDVWAWTCGGLKEPSVSIDMGLHPQGSVNFLWGVKGLCNYYCSHLSLFVRKA